MASSKWGKAKAAFKNFWRGNNVWLPNNKTKKNKYAKSAARNLYPKSQTKSELAYNVENLERIYGSSEDPKALVVNNGKPVLVMNSNPSSLEKNINLKPTLNVGPYRWVPKKGVKYIRNNNYVTPSQFQHLRGRNLGFLPSEDIYEPVKTPPSKKKSPWRFWSRGGSDNDEDPKPLKMNSPKRRSRGTFKNIEKNWKAYFPNKKSLTRKNIITSDIRHVMHHGKTNVGFRPKNDNKYLSYLVRSMPFYEKVSGHKKGGGLWNRFTRKSKVLSSTPVTYFPLEEVVVHDPNARPVVNTNEYMDVNWPEEYYRLRRRLPKGSKIPKGFESWTGENLGFIPGETRRRKNRSIKN